MVTSKLHIDILRGVIEVEGTEDLVREIYGEFKDRLVVSSASPKAPDNVSNRDQGQTRPTDQSGAKRRARSGREAPAIVRDLNLAARDGQPALKDWIGQFKLTTNMERNLAYVYWLKNVAQIDRVSGDHVFTCYRQMQIKLPEALEASIRDTGRWKGWLATSSLDDIQLTTLGINHIEHDLGRNT